MAPYWMGRKGYENGEALQTCPENSRVFPLPQPVFCMPAAMAWMEMIMASLSSFGGSSSFA